MRGLFIDWIINSVNLVGGQLIIKAHPRDSFQSYKRLVQKHDSFKKTIVTKDANLIELFKVSDIVITVSSTAGLLALAHKKLLLVAKCFSPDIENVLEEMAIVINQIDELPRSLKLILKDTKVKKEIEETSKKVLYRHLHYLDGKASKRIANLILYLTKQCTIQNRKYQKSNKTK